MQTASMNKSERLRAARKRAGFKTAVSAAEALGVRPPTYAGHENGSRDFDDDTAALYARRFHVDRAWLAFGQGVDPSGTLPAAIAEPATHLAEEPPNAVLRGDTEAQDPNDRTPVYGQAVGGDDGSFVFNGEKIDDVITPTSLKGVRGAYIVEFTGDSMEPRYFAGEQGHVHPRRAVRSGDFVVAQIASAEGEPPLAYVKQFVSMDAARLVLRQYNPPKELSFSREQVVSVHKIVGTG